MKLSALTLALIASLVLLSNNTNAATTAGNVSLQVLTGVSTCTVGGTWRQAGTINTSANTGSVTGSINSTFSCTDLNGDASRNMTLKADTALTGSNGQTIPAANVKMAAFANTRTAGTCTVGTNTTTFTAISPTAWTILSKAGILWDTCTIQSTGVQVAVTIPMYQAVGTYTGTMTITKPY